MYILGIYGRPFGLFEVNNELRLDFLKCIKESVDKEILDYKNVFYIIDSKDVDEVLKRMESFYEKLIINKRVTKRVSPFEYKVDGTAFYLVDVTKPSKLTDFTLEKIKELTDGKC